MESYVCSSVWPAFLPHHVRAINPFVVLVRVHPRVASRCMGTPLSLIHPTLGGLWLVSGRWLLPMRCYDHLWDHVSCCTLVLVAVGKSLEMVSWAGGGVSAGPVSAVLQGMVRSSQERTRAPLLTPALEQLVCVQHVMLTYW